MKNIIICSVVFLCGHHYGPEVLDFVGDIYDVAINALDNIKK